MTNTIKKKLISATEEMTWIQKKLLIDEKKIKHFSNINVTLNYFVPRANSTVRNIEPCSMLLKQTKLNGV